MIALRDITVPVDLLFLSCVLQESTMIKLGEKVQLNANPAIVVTFAQVSNRVCYNMLQYAQVSDRVCYNMLQYAQVSNRVCYNMLQYVS